MLAAAGAAAAACSFVLLLQEVCALQALEGSVLSSSQVDALLLDLGLVLRHISSSSTGSTAAAAGNMGHAAIAEKARRLIAFACDQGWAAVASAVLPLASACGTCAHDIVAAIHDSTAQVGAACVYVWLGVAPAVVLLQASLSRLRTTTHCQAFRASSLPSKGLNATCSNHLAARSTYSCIIGTP
jgi:hypothetical protein